MNHSSPPPPLNLLRLFHSVWCDDDGDGGGDTTLILKCHVGYLNVQQPRAFMYVCM